jgi:hypothetical protein
MAALRYPWEAEPVPVAPSPLPDPEEQLRKRRGRRAAARIHPASPVAPTPQWLYHHLTISGPAETVAAFAVAARGSGVVPWQLDFAAIEEAVFIRAVAQPAGRRNLTIEGCRILARQFREKIEARQARATESTRGRGRRCSGAVTRLAGGALGHHRSAAASEHCSPISRGCTQHHRHRGGAELSADRVHHANHGSATGVRVAGRRIAARRSAP